MATNQDSYDAIARQWTADREKSSVDALLVEFADKLEAGAEVLDIGCGSGLPNAGYLADRGFKVTGIDISGELVETAKKNVPGASFRQADVNDLDADTTYDGIVAWDSLFHLKPDEHEAVFAKIRKLLKPGGLFVFTHGGTEGELQGEMHGESFTYSSLGPEKTKHVLEGLGFVAVEWILDKTQENGYLKALAKETA